MASPPEMTEMYDNALLGILQHAGNVQDFLRIYFGFLYRKTDFYRLLSGPTDRMGFPPGVAQKMVLKTFRMFEQLADHDRERTLTGRQRKQESADVPPCVEGLEVVCESEPQNPETRAETRAEEGATNDRTDAAPSTPSDTDSESQKDQKAAHTTSTEGDQDFQCDADSFNGAVRETYSWSQDFNDVEVRVFVPKTVLKGRQVSVGLQSSSVCVRVRDGEEEKTLMEGELTQRINTEDSLWSLEPGNCVLLSLNKASEVWWNAVLRGEAQIDINKIHKERSMATVDEEEHAVLDRLTFDYHQKQQGKPQSHETKVHDMLKKGWDAEGSPFKGQTFDPSMFDVPPGAVQF